jgi:hypothetical protein
MAVMSRVCCSALNPSTNLFTASPCTAPSNWRYNRYTLRRPISFFVPFDIHLFNDLAIWHTAAAYAMYAVIESLHITHVRSHRRRIVSKEKEMVTPLMNCRERERERERECVCEKERVRSTESLYNSSSWWPCNLTLSFRVYDKSKCVPSEVRRC